MPDPSTLRDSTQIVLPAPELDGLREEVEEQFTVTVVTLEFEDADVEYRKVIGSPVVIKEVGEFLARQGVNLP